MTWAISAPCVMIRGPSRNTQTATNPAINNNTMTKDQFELSLVVRSTSRVSTLSITATRMPAKATTRTLPANQISRKMTTVAQSRQRNPRLIQIRNSGF